MKPRWKLVIVLTSLMLLFIIFQYRSMEKEAWSSWNLPLAGKIIYLDPGHGGPDGGAQRDGVSEKEITLTVSLKLRDYLQEQGALVFMTRETDKDLASSQTRGYSKRKTEDLKKRLQLINESESDLFISIHLNAIPSPRWSGAQTFYSPHFKENKRAAKFIQDELIENLGNTKREAKAISNVYILKYAKKPGSLVEIGFLSNPEERQHLVDPEYQNMVAASIYKGIARYFTDEEDLD